MKRTITTRTQCLAAATEDARDWAQQSITEEHQQLCNERGEDGAPDEETFADALEKYDSDMGGLSEAPSTSARIPARWADLYDRTLERVYRAEIRREIERLRGAAEAA